jgi:hypothetical protein
LVSDDECIYRYAVPQNAELKGVFWIIKLLDLVDDPERQKLNQKINFNFSHSDNTNQKRVSISKPTSSGRSNFWKRRRKADPKIRDRAAGKGTKIRLITW